MKIRIYGSGCEKCKKLAANVQTAAETLGVEFELEKVTDINAITDAGVMMTPALGVDGRIVSSGKVLSPEEAAKFLKSNGCSCGGNCGMRKETADKPKTSSCCCGTAEAAEAEKPSCCGGGKNGKKVLSVILLLFVLASLAFMIVRETLGKTAVPSDSRETTAVPVKNDVMTVYYFHGTKRCMTCNRIERMAREAMEAKFADAMKNGRIVFRSVNLEDPVNEHFVRDFQLATRTVVMEKNGGFEKFDEVWTLVREPEKFASYLQNGAEKMLESGK